MTIMEAINAVDTMKPNSYSLMDKLGWLSRLDARIKKEIIDTHEGGEDVIFHGYDDKTDTETELLVKAPYDELYLYWLESRIDYHNGEYGRYNNTVTTFNEAYAAFVRFYNRARMPKGKHFNYF